MTAGDLEIATLPAVNRPPLQFSERELQPELHHAVASRSDERIAGRDVGRGAAATEPAWA